MAGEKITARKMKAGGKQIIKKRVKKFQRHQSDQFMRVPVRVFPAELVPCSSCGAVVFWMHGELDRHAAVVVPASCTWIRGLARRGAAAAAWLDLRRRH